MLGNDPVTGSDSEDAVVAFVDRSYLPFLPRHRRPQESRPPHLSLLSSSLILICHDLSSLFSFSFLMSLDASVPRSMSSLSLHSTGSQNEDWDRSESDIPTDAQEFLGNGRPTTTPRNSVIFPADDGAEKTPGRTEAASHGKGERTLSQLLKLHAADGTEGKFSQEEASRIAEVLGQWVRRIVSCSSCHVCVGDVC